MSNCLLFTLLIISCVCQSAVGMFLMWRTTRSPKDQNQGPQLLKRDLYLPLKREQPSFSDDMYIDPSDFGIKFGKRSAPPSAQSAPLLDPLNLGISFGKRSIGKRSNEPAQEDYWSSFGTNFGKRSAPSNEDLLSFGTSFGKRAEALRQKRR